MAERVKRVSLIVLDSVDCDALYDHRNNPRGYADALEAFDRRLPEILSSLRLEDVLMITADHGNDPTTSGTDHSRERVAVGAHVKINVYLGTRETFADVAASVAEFLEIPWTGVGRSFAKVIYQPISTS